MPGYYGDDFITRRALRQPSKKVDYNNIHSELEWFLFIVIYCVVNFGETSKPYLRSVTLRTIVIMVFMSEATKEWQNVRLQRLRPKLTVDNNFNQKGITTCHRKQQFHSWFFTCLKHVICQVGFSEEKKTIKTYTR